MKIIDPGHHYELDSLDGKMHNEILFVKREGENYPGNTGHHPGTTSQEIIRALIDRARYVHNQIPCIETELAIHHLQTILFLFESRAARVHNRTLKIESAWNLERMATCDICGHLDCYGHE